MALIPSNEAQDFMKEVKNFDPNAGNILDWNDDKYYKDIKYMSNSMLKQLKDSPEHLKAYINYPAWRVTKQAYIDGRALHCFIFENDQYKDRFWHLDEVAKLEEIGGKKPRATSAYKEWKATIVEENVGKDEISYDWYYSITLIKEKLDKLPQVKQLLNNTKKEIAYWKKLNGIDCKCKTDAVQPGNYIVDLKGFKEVPNPQQFEKLCYRYDLFRQAAFYCDIVGVKQFWFLAVEKTYPFTVGLYEISEENLNKGREQYEHLLEVHKRSTGDLEDFLYMGTI